MEPGHLESKHQLFVGKDQHVWRGGLRGREEKTFAKVGGAQNEERDGCYLEGSDNWKEHCEKKKILARVIIET